VKSLVDPRDYDADKSKAVRHPALLAIGVVSIATNDRSVIYLENFFILISKYQSYILYFYMHNFLKKSLYVTFEIIFKNLFYKIYLNRD